MSKRTVAAERVTPSGRATRRTLRRLISRMWSTPKLWKNLAFCYGNNPNARIKINSGERTEHSLGRIFHYSIELADPVHLFQAWFKGAILS